MLAIALSRREHDFSDDERNLLDRARPFLIQTYRNAIEYSRLRTDLELRQRGSRLPLEHPRLAAALAQRGVTRREAEILSFAATGLSDRQIAGVLGVSERTIQTHLRRCYIEASRSPGRALTNPTPTPLAVGFAFLETPRRHHGRLWAADMFAARVVAVDPDGRIETRDVPGVPTGIAWTGRDSC